MWGGEKMSISRDTLTRAEGSLLATMFSGQWTDKLPKDSDGNIFLDHDPILFKFLLNQLRAWSNPSTKRVFRLPVGSEESFLELLRLLEFDERYIEVKTTTAGDTTKIIQVQQEVESFSTQNLVEVRLIDNNRRCEKVTRDSWQRVFGELDYVTGIHRIQFKLESGSANILIGVCSRNTPPTATPFYCQPTTHGWFNHGYVITNGYGFFPGWPQVNENDILELTINCEQRLLCIRNDRSGAENNMQIDINRAPLPWCLLVLLFYQGSQVLLL